MKKTFALEVTESVSDRSRRIREGEGDEESCGNLEFHRILQRG